MDQLSTKLRGFDSPEEGIRLINLFEKAGLKFQPALYRDTLHFKSATYRRLTSVLKDALEKLLASLRRDGGE